MFTNWIKFSARLATEATPMAIMPQANVNHLDALTICSSVLLDVFLLYKSIVVVDPNAFNSLEVLDIAALKITANSSPMSPRGKLFKMDKHIILIVALYFYVLFFGSFVNK